MVDQWLLQDVSDENNDGNDQATQGNDVPNLRDLLHAQDGLETLIRNNGRIHIEVTQEEFITFMERINSTLAGFSGRELYHLLISEEGWTCVMKTLVRLRLKHPRFRAMITENASVLRFSSFWKSFLFQNAHSDIIFRQLKRRNNEDRQGRFEALPRAIQECFLYGPKL